MNDLEKVIRGMESLKTRLIDCGDGLDGAVVANAIALLKAQDAELERLKNCRAECKIECLLDEYNKVVAERDALRKAQEPVKPMLARGWYWCGGVGCRNSLTSALDDDSPARKPKYCEKCGRAVKWDE